eukprot:CAMPEP_0172155976 /NCGR_PEP_ID=MMETSP1050-20130122/2932_1 /TAXON_ID=233186 /ORGANISM="Cryptomonas curvata, Strain CCAP979/52" /LENGTH=120 /DNA_ID=CAMNT_0012824949 /DNA_START=49 /DNA_END=408 /DNA_ORIENTATION=+
MVPSTIQVWAPSTPETILIILMQLVQSLIPPRILSMSSTPTHSPGHLISQGTTVRARSNQPTATTTHKALRMRERRATGTERPSQATVRWTTLLLQNPGMVWRSPTEAPPQAQAHPLPHR